VSADGVGVVSHTGFALLRGLADRVGVTGWLDEELAPIGGIRPRGGGHTPGRVLTDLAVMIADGGEAIAELGVLADQPVVHGPVASAGDGLADAPRAVADRGQTGLDALARGRAGPGNGPGWPASSPVARMERNFSIRMVMRRPRPGSSGRRPCRGWWPRWRPR